MQKVPLFINKKEQIVTFLVGLILFFISLGFEFYKFKNITTYSIYKDNFTVINYYEKISKKGKRYSIVKLKNSDFTFNGIFYKPLHVKRFDEVEAIIYTKSITFKKYLKGFYAPLKTLHVTKEYRKNRFLIYIENQHENIKAKELYKALFFATPLNKELREDIAKWGISHLVAISGFHFGLIGGILFLILKPFYTFFQDRFFPYRNKNADLAFLVLILLGMYGYILGFSPSVLRAFVMGCIGYFIYVKHMKIISFTSLFLTAGVILILYPKLIFSIAFWFSISGVFYLFLFLHYFDYLSKSLQFILINFWVFFCMMPVVHFVFDTFSWYQFISPLISMLFVVFYPISLFLHVVGAGGVFDEWILKFLSLHVETFSIVTPFWFLSAYVILSLLAVRYRLIAFVLPLISFYILI